MSVLERHAVTTYGCPRQRPVMLGHGFAADQSMWRFLVPALVDTHHVVTFDHLGHGRADRAEPADEYAALDRYAADVLEICAALDLHDVVFVGHSVGGIIGALAANANPDRFAGLILIGSSPRFVNDGDYEGCNPDCTRAGYCGDGVRQPAHEECDAGPAGGAGCTDQCVVQVG